MLWVIRKAVVDKLLSYSACRFQSYLMLFEHVEQVIWIQCEFANTRVIFHLISFQELSKQTKLTKHVSLGISAALK